MADKMTNSFPKSKILSTEHFINTFKTGMKNNERFCFVLGSGASVESGIPMGGTLEMEWMGYLMGESPDSADNSLTSNPQDTKQLADELKEEGKLQHEFKQIQEAWEKAKKEKRSTLSSEYYFDLFKLRFHPNHRNGYYYLQNLMEGKEPSFGYHPLAQLLTDGKRNNLVITTNFDSLVEDALFMYTRSKPLVINHELLADYIDNQNIQRPIIAKVHRGMFFDPLNDPENTQELKGRWHQVLEHAFRIYTPIVVGYGGGDHSLMDFLKEKSTEMPNGIYWCYMEEYGLPDENIRDTVRRHDGCLVKMHGFDAFMLAIGNELYPDKISTNATEKYLTARTNERIDSYNKAVAKLEKKANESVAEESEDAATASEALQEFVQREEEEKQERENNEQLTAWDYNKQGYAYYYNGEQYEEAIECFGKAIQIQPDNAMFYYNRGASYSACEKYKKALLDYNEAIRLDSQHVETYYNRGIAHYMLKEYDKALADFDMAIKFNPQYSYAYNNRGFIHEERAEYGSAILDYTLSTKFDSQNVEAYVNRGNVYRKLGEYEKALSDYNVALNLNPQHKEALKNRKKTLQALGRSEEE